MIKRISLDNLNVFLSTLCFVLSIIGYQFATTLFLPLSSDVENASQIITIPYRAFALFISILVVVLNRNNKVKKTSVSFKLLIIYWAALIVRIFYDTNINININNTSQLWLYIFGICLPSMFALIKSYSVIDFNKALNWIFWGLAFSLIISVFNNSALLFDSDQLIGRVGGNLALNTISFGHLGTMGVVLSLFMLSNYKGKKKTKIIYIIVLILSFIVLVRAGSRGPIVALFVVLLFWMFSKSRNIVRGIFVLAATIGLLLFFMEPILSLIGDISPVMEARLKNSIYEGNTSGRDGVYRQGIDIFIDNPIIGKQFALFDGTGSFNYTHNIIIDSLMGLGILGGGIMIYFLYSAIKTSFRNIKFDNPIFWTGLLLIQQIVLNMLSGAFYFNQALNVLLVLLLLNNNIILNSDLQDKESK